MTATKPLLRAQVAQSTPIPANALVTNQLEERAILEHLTGLGLNVAAFPRNSLQQLHDSITIELHARAGRIDRILQEQKLILNSYNSNVMKQSHKNSRWKRY